MVINVEFRLMIKCRLARVNLALVAALVVMSDVLRATSPIFGG